MLMSAAEPFGGFLLFIVVLLEIDVIKENAGKWVNLINFYFLLFLN